jgi:anti-sigma regulatory factor (Ser/Thr protein kinase)
MTQVARPAPRRLDAFELPSEPGNERLALARVAETVQGLGLSDSRLEKLKTAVAEATMNAIEHGNGNRAEIPVQVEASSTPKPAEEPDLLKKLDGGQSPRGWGLFLIRNMVDAMDITINGQRHTIWLTMRTGGAAHGEHV